MSFNNHKYRYFKITDGVQVCLSAYDETALNLVGFSISIGYETLTKENGEVFFETDYRIGESMNNAVLRDFIFDSYSQEEAERFAAMAQKKLAE